MGEPEILLPGEEQQPLVPPAVKKVLVWLAGIMVMLLMLSYVFVSFPVGDILRGRVESFPLAGNTLQAGNLMLIFEEGTLAQLHALYLQEQGKEFAVCLQGKNEDSTYHLTSLYQPAHYRQTFTHVRFESCSTDTLILLHTHPYKRCVASQTDLDTLQKSKELNPAMLMVVMCEPGRFAVYS